MRSTRPRTGPTLSAPPAGSRLRVRADRSPGPLSEVDRLRFATYLAPNVLPVYEAVTEEVGRRLGIMTELVVETSYESCAEDANEVCFVCSLPYVEFERQG